MDAETILALATLYEFAAKKKKKRKGRSEKSVKKQYKTMTKGKKHPFKTMVDKFKKHPKEIDNPEALAAWMKDIGTGSKDWRKGPKKKKKKKK